MMTIAIVCGAVGLTGLIVMFYVMQNISKWKVRQLQNLERQEIELETRLKEAQMMNKQTARDLQDAKDKLREANRRVTPVVEVVKFDPGEWLVEKGLLNHDQLSVATKFAQKNKVSLPDACAVLHFIDMMALKQVNRAKRKHDAAQVA